MNPTYDLLAVITGTGMGLATAHAIAESGAAAVLSDRNEQTLRTATTELISAGRQARRNAAPLRDDVGCPGRRSGTGCGLEPDSGFHAAYHAKYDRYGPRIVGSVVGPNAEAVTIRLVPC